MQAARIPINSFWEFTEKQPTFMVFVVRLYMLSAQLEADFSNKLNAFEVRESFMLFNQNIRQSKYWQFQVMSDIKIWVMSANIGESTMSGCSLSQTLTTARKSHSNNLLKIIYGQSFCTVQGIPVFLHFSREFKNLVCVSCLCFSFGKIMQELMKCKTSSFPKFAQWAAPKFSYEHVAGLTSLIVLFKRTSCS